MFYMGAQNQQVPLLSVIPGWRRWFLRGVGLNTMKISSASMEASLYDIKIALY
ncbi:hypothetical protein KSP39_PZI023248 [Platanthera zijinensis]|uniref:Uncharacterized protein n=1 Tax=Platanthera zijinensis TaxID=2320716 RepID=A0AAP0AW98_9ASPA